jgi:hypothetical protein
MALTLHRRGARSRARAASTPDPHRAAETTLTIGQQEYLTLHGFGPTAPRSDFGDPEVRARFVRVLRECGALPPAPSGTVASPARRHPRRAG